MNVKLVQIDFSDWKEYHVSCVMHNHEVESDSVFSIRSEAESRARKLSKLYGCEWESNY